VAEFHSELVLEGRYDAAVVFFAGFQGDVPNDESRARLELAMEYCELEFCRDLLIVGGSRKERDFSGAEKLAAFSKLSGQLKGRVFVGKKSYDSVSNLNEVRQFARDRGWKRLLFVSSPLHIVRLAWLSEREDFLVCHFQSEDLIDYCDRRGLFFQSMHEWLGYLSVMLLPDRYRNCWLTWFR